MATLTWFNPDGTSPVPITDAGFSAGRCSYLGGDRFVVAQGGVLRICTFDKSAVKIARTVTPTRNTVGVCAQRDTVGEDAEQQSNQAYIITVTS